MARCAFLFFVSFLSLAAQTASITGTVSDPQQAPIPNVSVTLTNVATGIAVRANTDVEGNYEFGFVQPGNYIIKVKHPGFRAYQQGPIKSNGPARARQRGAGTGRSDVRCECRGGRGRGADRIVHSRNRDRHAQDSERSR